MSLATSAILPPYTVSALAREWLAEDTPTFDIGGMVVGDLPVEAHLLFKSAPRTAAGTAVGGAVLAGVPFFTAIFEALGCTVEWAAREGEVLAAPLSAAVVRGPARCVLLGERTALNVLARASGVATGARAFAGVAAAAGWGGQVAGSRKVTPGGFRLVEKYALLVGGVATHRMDLSQMVMLKGAAPLHTAPPASFARAPTLYNLTLYAPRTKKTHATPHRRPQTTMCGRRAPFRPRWAPQSARAASAQRWRWRRGGWRRRLRRRARVQTW